MTSFLDPDLESGTPELSEAQEERRSWAVFGAGAGAAAAVGLAGLLAWPKPPVAPPATGGQFGRFPDVPLVTHEGKTVRFYSDLVKGRIVFMNMMYAQCSDRCPPMTQNLKRVQEALGERVGRDVFMYSVSLLPEFDRPADLKAYMDLHRIGPGWTFLTGTKADVEQVRRAMGFVDVDPVLDADLSEHIGLVRIGNDAIDRWCMTPALSEPHLILETLMAMDPVSRATGRTWAVPQV